MNKFKRQIAHFLNIGAVRIENKKIVVSGKFAFDFHQTYGIEPELLMTFIDKLLYG